LNTKRKRRKNFLSRIMPSKSVLHVFEFEPRKKNFRISERQKKARAESFLEKPFYLSLLEKNITALAAVFL